MIVKIKLNILLLIFISFNMLFSSISFASLFDLELAKQQYKSFDSQSLNFINTSLNQHVDGLNYRETTQVGELSDVERDTLLELKKLIDFLFNLSFLKHRIS